MRLIRRGNVDVPGVGISIEGRPAKIVGIDEIVELSSGGWVLAPIVAPDGEIVINVTKKEG